MMVERLGSQQIVWSDALFFAKHTVRRQWRSFLLTFFYTAMLAVYFVFVFSGRYLSTEGFRDGSSTMMDMLLILLILCIGTNYMSGEYWASGSDRFIARRVYLRSLPVSSGSVIAGRILANLVAFVPNLLSLWIAASVMGYPEGGSGQRLALIATLAGLALVGPAAVVLIEMSITIKRYWLYSVLSMVVLFPLLLSVAIFTGFSFERFLRDVSSAHPLLTVAVAWFIGAGGLIVLARFAMWSFLNRDPVP